MDTARRTVKDIDARMEELCHISVFRKSLFGWFVMAS
jgi:hypothetical protein